MIVWMEHTYKRYSSTMLMHRQHDTAIWAKSILPFIQFTGVPALFARYLRGVPESYLNPKPQTLKPMSFNMNTTANACASLCTQLMHTR